MTLVAIDASYWLHKACSAMPSLNRSDGEPVGAMLGYSTMLWRFINKPPAPFSHIVATFDIGGETWRHKLAAGYKASRKVGRKEGRHALWKQRDRIYDMTRAMGVATLMQEGVEADDLLATLAHKCRKRGERVIIVSSDKDLAQCVVDDPDAPVTTWDINRNEMVDEAGVRARYGVEPKQIPDWLALVGDTADDIPGVYGIGKVKAAAILRKHRTIRDILDNTAALPVSGSLREALIVDREQIELSAKLASTCRYIQFEETIESFAWAGPDIERVLEICKENGFTALAKRIEES